MTPITPEEKEAIVEQIRLSEKAQAALMSDLFLKIVSGVVIASMVVKRSVPPGSLAHAVTEGIIEAGGALGVYSSVGRQAK
jgi:hypothetical protein